VVKVDEKKLKGQIFRDGVLTIQLQNCNWSLHFAILAGPHCGSVESMVIGSGRTPPDGRRWRRSHQRRQGAWIHL
jgi:hypothetical protein